MTLSIDPSQLTDEQLQALALIDQDAYAAELSRRKAYASVSDFLTDLFQAGLDLSTILGQARHTYAGGAVKDSKVIEIIERGMAWAKNNQISFQEPEVRQIVVQKVQRGSPDA